MNNEESIKNKDSNIDNKYYESKDDNDCTNSRKEMIEEQKKETSKTQTRTIRKILELRSKIDYKKKDPNYNEPRLMK